MKITFRSPRIRNGSFPSGRRGSALIVVLLVVLVLTVVGLGVAYFSSTEDKTSGNVKSSGIGFYAAEAGLREAEAAVGSYLDISGGRATGLLTGSDTIKPPGGGYKAFLLETGERTFKDVIIDKDKPLGDANTRAIYSVYIRNNAEDKGSNGSNGETVDFDGLVNLVVIGQVVLVDSSGNIVRNSAGQPTVGITKVLEEQLGSHIEGSADATQKGTNVGGTSSGAK